MNRFEKAVESIGDEITGQEDDKTQPVGIFLPRSAEAAGELPSKWIPLKSATKVPTRLVLLIHGLDEPGDIWSDLAPEIVNAGHAVGRFEYPNDQPVHESAATLIESLGAAREAGVQHISIIAHSMGGLVAFDAMTREDGYAGKVGRSASFPQIDRFITVGTPWAGSPWAKLRIVAEIREQAQRWYMNESWDLRPLLQFRADGQGGAGEDLSSGSKLIRTLLSRPMPVDLTLTVIAGRMVESGESDLAWVKESILLREILGKKRVESLVVELADAGRTLGDGVVPIDSALARAGNDEVVLEANHRGLIRRTPIDRGPASTKPPGIAVILDRLAADRKAAEVVDDDR